jgi:hypothetical protein
VWDWQNEITDDDALYTLLLNVCGRYEVDPSSSIESEAFFRDLLARYPGAADHESLAVWLHEQIPRHFVALGERPQWIQGAAWPYANGLPMIFAGQLDLNRAEREKVVPTLYHDDTSLYVFIGRGVAPVVVLQQY